MLNQISPANISNYLAAIRAQCIVFNLNTACFQHQQIQYFLKSLKINRPLQPKIHKHIDTQLLNSIIRITETLHHPQVFKSLYILAFFSFLRLSNILPHAISTFDNTRHLAKGDVIFDQDQVLLIIKWSKTMQKRARDLNHQPAHAGFIPIVSSRCIVFLTLTVSRQAK